MNRFIKLSTFLSLTFFLIFLSSCRRDCNEQDVNLGHVQHNDLTLSFIHYTDGQTLTFNNPDGELKTFTVMQDQKLDPRLCVEVTCRPTFEDVGQNACNYYTADGNYFLLVSEDDSLHFRTGIETFQPETELFYEYLEIGVSRGVDSLYAGLFTANNFGSTSLSAFNTILQNDLIFQDSAAIGSVSNVFAFANEETNDYLLLDQEKGIFEYQLLGQRWQLKE